MCYGESRSLRQIGRPVRVLAGRSNTTAPFVLTRGKPLFFPVDRSSYGRFFFCLWRATSETSLSESET